jgi:hypothetical protein
MPDVDRLCRTLGFSVIPTGAMIDHLGYDGSQDHKHPRNLPLLQAELKKGHDRVYYYYPLAEPYAALGDISAAQQTAREGLAVARQLLDCAQQGLTFGKQYFSTVSRPNGTTY